MSLRPLIRSALVLALVTAALPVAAARFEVQAGRSYMDSHGANAAFVEAVFAPQPLGQTRFTWSPDVSLGWIDGRRTTTDSSRYTTRDSVALLAAGARFHLGEAGDWYQPLFFSEQLAATNHTTHALSSHYQFVSTLGWQAKHFSVAIRHISNGGLHRPNAGETMALVGVAFDI
ncbi:MULTISPECIES: acyloxyacyl hydrolase [unclassified Rhodanobacter]|uniref:acyloxyacyl hydrolase n=1 Tax=unclassified Rhodanobacter TaxID=2621553 RepID=UPI001BDEC700|nr:MULTISPECIES: acyloxyacyl hydrolase [unclassified Rhodanobacter]MBT2143976.1 acyloxyacyl hydrolase [Rhodanobacter sp. LX-99]MBT2146950.1 acyloxyacyl hydrolase [Rhodanobacter sp. LX-100]